MRYAILGDIHSNLVAFEAVIQDLKKKGGFDIIWCLGDLVGYGPEPHACIELLREYEQLCIAGNHDWAAIDKIDTLDFNEDAALANLWTAQQLTDDDKNFLKSLPLIISEGSFTMAHGSPREPIWEYLSSIKVAQNNMKSFTTQFCLVGHSHIPLIFEYFENSINLHKLENGNSITLGTNRLIINPGSVGQPRDNDPRASYALYDSDAGIIYHHRIEYNIEATQLKMHQQKLPEFLIHRLRFGM